MLKQIICNFLCNDIVNIIIEFIEPKKEDNYNDTMVNFYKLLNIIHSSGIDYKQWAFI